MKAIWWNLAIACTVLGGFEAYLSYKQAPARRDIVQDTGGERQAMSGSDDVLGYAPIRDTSGVWTRYIGDEFVFRINYTIDSLGLRVSPPADDSTDRPCVFFFGGSYTFGSGVNDVETFAYRAGVKTEGTYRIFNFGFRGYGPHQMLATLEENSYEQDLGCQPGYVIYQMIPGHVSRAAGYSSWDKSGPRFVVDDDGDVVLAGTFDDMGREAPGLIGRLLRRSAVYRQLLRFFAPKPDERSAQLTFAIIERAGEIVSERNPDSAFHVVYWPSDQPTVKDVIDRLLASDLNVHSIADVLPEFDTDRGQYRLHRYDGHPNARGHEMIADYVVDEILVD